jgi:hypothetical protein
VSAGRPIAFSTVDHRGRVSRAARRNPAATQGQLTAFASGYDAALASAYLGDADLDQPANFLAAVAFTETAQSGLDTDIGRALLGTLGVTPAGFTRELQASRRCRTS